VPTLAELEASVTAEWEAHAGDWPNLPNADTYVQHALALGFTVQPIIDADGPGAYYSIIALYHEADGSIFGREPKGIIFEDFSKSYDITWVFQPSRRQYQPSMIRYGYE
jgi:hypothetical protein